MSVLEHVLSQNGRGHPSQGLSPGGSVAEGQSQEDVLCHPAKALSLSGQQGPLMLMKLYQTMT